MTRKLATLRNISDVRPIEGADAIELVIVDGWQVVAKKGDFSPGDLCVYFEVDSVLPIKPEYEFLRKGCYVKKDWIAKQYPATHPTGEGFRLKTIKLRGQISQGLVTKLPHEVSMHILANIEADNDLTEFMGVIKWDPPVPTQLAGRAKGNFPMFIRKTDQERVQNLSGKFWRENGGDPYEVTMKLDGSSCTVYYNNGQVGVCSRNFDLDLGEENQDNSFVKMANETNILSALSLWCQNEGRNIAIQGELMGPGVQGNRERFSELRYYVFDIFDIDTQSYIAEGERNVILLQLEALGCKIYSVPFVDYMVPQIHTMNELLAFAVGRSINNPIREGVVLKNLKNPNISFKIISNEYLLGEE